MIVLREQMTVSAGGEALCPNCRRYAALGKWQRATIDAIAWAVALAVLALAVVTLWVTANGGGAVP